MGRNLIGILLVSSAIGCGGSARLGGNAPPDMTPPPQSFTIQITPAQVTLTVANDTQVTQSYTAMATFADGSTRDVTADAYWSLEAPQFASFAGATLTTTGSPGGTVVHASWSGVDAKSALTVLVSKERVISGAPTNAPALFAAATESSPLAPKLIYPADDTVMPPNIGDFEVHWTDTAGANLFQVVLASALVQVKLYAKAAPNASAWTALSLATTNDWATLASDARGSTFKVTVRALNTANPSVAGTTPPLTIRLSKTDLMGGIYYWSPSAAQPGIYRHDFSDPAKPPEAYYNNSSSPPSVPFTGGCVGCHSISRDGAKFSLSYQLGCCSVSHWGGVLDTGTRTPAFSPNSNMTWMFPTFEPPLSNRLVTTTVVNTGILTLRDAATGNSLGNVPTPGYASMPDFSPDGTKLAYMVSLASSHSDEAHLSQGEIVVQDYDSTSATFGSSQVLVAQTDNFNNYYPNWSPDGKWILFNRSTGGSYHDSTAQLFAVPVDGSQAPILLSAANQDATADLTNSWPKFAPFIETDESGETNNRSLFWFTFSSTRSFGARPVSGAQIWMAPFYWGNGAQGHDPSAPAFHLPFQDNTTSNHSAQWTQTVVPAPPIN